MVVVVAQFMTAYVVLAYCDGIEAQTLGPIILQGCDTVGWVTWPVKTRPQYDL